MLQFLRMVSVRNERGLWTPHSTKHLNSNGSLNGHGKLVVIENFALKAPHTNGQNGHQPLSRPHRLFDFMKHRYDLRKERKANEDLIEPYVPRYKTRLWRFVAVGMIGIIGGIPLAQNTFDSQVDRQVDRAAARFEKRLKDFEGYRSFKKFADNVNEVKKTFGELSGKEFKKAFASFLLENNIDGSELADVIQDPEAFLKQLEKEAAKKKKKEAEEQGILPTVTTVPQAP